MAADTPGAAAEAEGFYTPRKIDQAETYRRINVKRQLQFAKHVLAEKKALELAQRFEDEMEQYWQDKETATRQREKTIQDRRFRAVRDHMQLQAISGRMQAEERNQVAAMIRESNARKSDQLKTESEKKHVQRQLALARSAYEKDRREKQTEQGSERATQILAQVEEREQARSEALRALQEEKREERAAAVARREAWRAKAAPLIEARRAEGNEGDAPLSERYTAATRRRAAQLEEAVRQAKARNAVIAEVAERKKAMIGQQMEQGASTLSQSAMKRKTVIDSQARKILMLQNEKQVREQRCQERKEAWEAEQRERAEHLKARVEAKDAKVRQTYTIVHHEVDPHIQYFKVSQELAQQKHAALTTKEYTPKMVAEAEEIAKAAPYDTRLKRLEELEVSLSKHSTSAGPSVLSARTPSEMEEANRKRVFGIHTVRCGLCEQEFTTDLLKGVTTVARIEKLRRGWMGEAEAAQSVDLLHASAYDSVRLCAMCLQLVRQHTNKDPGPVSK